MSNFELKLLANQDIGLVTDLASKIYEGENSEKYPEFRMGHDLNLEKEREKYFTAFMLPERFKNFNQRRAYGIYQDDKLVSAVGVRRHQAPFPSWSFSWLLSPSIGARFIPMFRFIIEELTKVHEAAGMNEYFVTYPEEREEVYSRIMLFMRERYFTFVECTVEKGTVSPYPFIRELMGITVPTYNMNLRRYILRRENTEPASEGGTAIRKAKNINETN